MIRSSAFLAAAFALAAIPAQAQERMGADVTCKQVEKTMAYDCLIVLKGMLSGHPVQGAGVGEGGTVAVGWPPPPVVVPQAAIMSARPMSSSAPVHRQRLEDRTARRCVEKGRHHMCASPLFLPRIR